MIERRFRDHPGRGGCGVGAVVDLERPSHDILEMALAGLGCLEHRGGAIEDTGDGAGLLLTTDSDYYARFIAPGRRLPEGHRLAVGVLFFPAGETPNLPHWQHEIDATLRRRGLTPLGWRRVPVDESVLGKKAHESRRDVWQLLIGEGMVPDEELARFLRREEPPEVLCGELLALARERRARDDATAVIARFAMVDDLPAPSRRRHRPD